MADATGNARSTPSAPTLEAVLTRNLAHTYGLDGYAARELARERLAAFENTMAVHVPVLAALQRVIDEFEKHLAVLVRVAKLVNRPRRPEPPYVAFTVRPERQRRAR